MSDQDFFFDEDETPAQKATEKTSKPAAKSAPPKGAKPAPTQTSGGVELTWTVTALIAVVTLLLGVIVGYSIPKGSSADTTGTSNGQTQTQTQAPQLSPEELQSGELPEGHPDIGGATGSGGTTGSAETTNN